MLALVLVVHDELQICAAAVAALKAAGVEALGCYDAMAALDAVEADSDLRVVVTRVNFGEDKLNGMALARMLRVKRPQIHTVIVGKAEYERPGVWHTTFLPAPLDPQVLVPTVQRLLEESG